MGRKDLARDIMRAANIMRADDGTTSVVDYIEQMSWMIFLKIFEDLELRFEKEHQLRSESYVRIIPKEYTWSTWTKKEWRGDELIDFINEDLFSFLSNLSGTKEKETIANIFSEIKSTKMKSTSNFLDVVDIIDEIDFNDPVDSHTLSQFYEELLLKMGKESGYAGEFYTPRPIVRLMVKMVNPKSGKKDQVNRLIDPFCGSCGFLVESYKHILENENIPTYILKELQRNTFHGHEKKSLPYLLGVMNCILHEILTPNISRKNSLNENVLKFNPDDKFDYVFTNPPFGGLENKQVRQNFPIKVSSTELLSLQHVMRRLKDKGICAMVVPTSILSNTDTSHVSVKKDLLENYDLYAIVSLPAGVFANVTSSGIGPKTSLLFFKKDTSTRKIWYYELPEPEKTYSKSNPIKDSELIDCFTKFSKQETSESSWFIDISEIAKNNYNIVARNPFQKQEDKSISANKLMLELESTGKSMTASLKDLSKILSSIREIREIKIRPMSDFLKLRRDFIMIDDKKEYRRITVQTHARGIILRDSVLGSQIRTKKQQLTKVHDLIVAEIDAKVGGYGIIPLELSDSIVSNHYFLYAIDQNIIRPEYLEFYLKTEKPSLDLERGGMIKGSHNYASIRPDSFLQLKMPVPEMPEQDVFIQMQKKIDELKLQKTSLEQRLDKTHNSIFDTFLNIKENLI